MRITRIKLSGFKSFVDPTSITLPGNLTGVVGPNGCGKSNIIDALIWVLGESSAKHLRGDSMADVIFNGSNTRKPVGQATVEIIFDNTDGTIGGQYAGFGEISIKRSVTRDGVSAYFLNGARCRRKDITNVFLGTGIGARGYSVIEQGMISRVIEARPEELRGFLEEAAGISKYKERRRETENRMRHTDENIERLTDIREELDKQLTHLQRQSRAAERYQALKAEERKLSARALAVRWRALEQEHQQGRVLAEQRSNELEAEVAGLRAIEARQIAHREAQVEASEVFNRLQSEFYARSAEISRLEQALRHAEEREQSLTGDLEEARGALSESTRALEQDGAQLDGVRAKLAEVEPRFVAQQSAEQAAYAAVRAAEVRLDDWQHESDAFNREHGALAQREQGVQIRLEHLLDDLAGADTRARFLNDEATRNETADLATTLDTLKAELRQAEQERDRVAAVRIATRANLSQIRGSTHTLGTALHEHQGQLEEQRGRLSSLRALQEAAYGGDHAAIEAFFKTLGISDVERLAALVEIEAGWERALEAALRIPLGTLCGANLTARIAGGNAPDMKLTVMDTAATGTPTAAPGGADTLASKVRGAIQLAPLLKGVYIAADVTAARARARQLAAEEFIALADGTLIGSNWMQLPGSNEDSQGILARERIIAELAAQVEKHDADTTNLRLQVEAAQARVKEMEQDEQVAGEQLEVANQGIARLRTELGRLDAEFQRREARAADVAAELERITEHSTSQQEAVERLKHERDQAMQALEQHAERRETLGASRSAIQDELDGARQRWREVRDAAHQLELGMEQLRARRAALDEAIARNSAAHDVATRRCRDLDHAIAAARTPRADMRAELERGLQQRLSAENELAQARRGLSELDESLQQAAAERANVEQSIATAQRRLEQARLDQRALEVRLQELSSRFEQTGEDPATTMANLGDGDSEASVQEELERIASRIVRLGPINLAAIDEYTQLSERKAYLDRQHADLAEALDTLQEAIRKIDRETRSRFRETFEKVNNGLQAMFPVLFGGGQAYLEMTGDDLLETGVTVMARPPGKRNSTIHLLSGGEKALTALAFVFSIFELNPAPFCLLDEVDAPLDDNNIVRLTEMLRSMAKSVQFLFVTHNKITMEIAEQLIGVTMQEAGVSRLVAVNMEEAVELAASA